MNELEPADAPMGASAEETSKNSGPKNYRLAPNLAAFRWLLMSNKSDAREGTGQFAGRALMYISPFLFAAAFALRFALTGKPHAVLVASDQARDDLAGLLQYLAATIAKHKTIAT